MSITLGPYHAGEIPPRLVVTFENADGDALLLTGYTAKLTYRSYGGSWVTRSAVVDNQVTNKGQAYYDWVAADFVAAGDFEGEMWVGNAGQYRFASVHLDWQTIPAVNPSLTI